MRVCESIMSERARERGRGKQSGAAFLFPPHVHLAGYTLPRKRKETKESV